MKSENMEKLKPKMELETPALTSVFSQHLVTTKDLEIFREKLIAEISQLIREHGSVAPKKWLKTYEVRQLLNISPGTLQHLKANGTIPFSKVGGSHYYDYQKIQSLLSEEK